MDECCTGLCFVCHTSEPIFTNVEQNGHRFSFCYECVYAILSNFVAESHRCNEVEIFGAKPKETNNAKESTKRSGE